MGLYRVLEQAGFSPKQPAIALHPNARKTGARRGPRLWRRRDIFPIPQAWMHRGTGTAPRVVCSLFGGPAKYTAHVFFSS
jgi:hypothetical protein